MMSSCHYRRLVRAALLLLVFNGLVITLLAWIELGSRDRGVKFEYHVNTISLSSSTQNTSHVQSTLSVADILEERVNRTTRLCAKSWSQKLGSTLTSYVFFDDPRKLAQCFIAKIGTTYWGRIFSFLTRHEKMKTLNIHSPSEISRIQLHHLSGVRGKLIWASAWEMWFDERTLRYMFVRNPYNRLWSTYLDKYYLPSFWGRYPLTSSGLCQTDVKFQTFLKFALISDDDHIIPVSTACNPCAFRPHIIGKMESFAVDTKHILQRTNYSHLLHNYNETSFVEREISTIVDYNYVILKAYRVCFTNQSMARRLWRVFQINGFIKTTSNFPLNRKDYGRESAMKMCIDESKANPMSRRESKQQKRQFLVDAYKNIPQSIIASIQDRFQADFELFDYDKNPPS